MRRFIWLLIGVGCGDADGDGFAGEEDCNDDDPTIRPGADEIDEDGVDQDCDGADTVERGFRDLLDEATFGANSAGFCSATAIELDQPVRVTDLGIAVQVTFVGEPFQVALYADEGQRPGRLLASATDEILTSGDNDVSIAPVDVEAGLAWVALCSAVEYESATVSQSSRTALTPFTDVLPDPFGGQTIPALPAQRIVWLRGTVPVE